jgi:hypothetical protein
VRVTLLWNNLHHTRLKSKDWIRVIWLTIEETKMVKWIWFRQISLATGYQRPHGFGSDKLALQRATNDHMDLVQTN